MQLCWTMLIKDNEKFEEVGKKLGSLKVLKNSLKWSENARRNSEVSENILEILNEKKTPEKNHGNL